MRALETLLTDAFNVGIYLKVNSAYRTYQDQVRVRATAKLPSATPGTSNHGFGLAVDLANSTGTRINPSLTPKEWQWIQANKNKYNFENINNDSESHHYNFTKPGKNC
jgi:LAS superfamily LD-carboxypeptidase LdcB